MNLTYQTILFKNENKFYIPHASTEYHPLEAVTANAKLQQYGYSLSAKSLEQLAKLTIPEIASYYNQLEKLVKESAGTKISEADIFYPNFPNEVMRMNDFELYMNAVFYYTGEYLFKEDWHLHEEKLPQMPITENFKRKTKTITFVDEKEIHKMMNNFIHQTTPLNQTKLDDLKKYCELNPDWKEKFLKRESGKIFCKENLAQIALLVYDTAQTSKDFRYLYEMLHDTPDVLRFAALLSNRHLPKEKQNDASLKNNKIWFNFKSSKEKRLVKNLLNNCPNLAKDIWKREEVYKVLFRNSGIDINKGCPERLNKIVDNFLHNKKEDEFGNPIITSGRMQKEAITTLKENGDITKLQKFAKAYPGDFLRSFANCIDSAKNEEQQKQIADILVKNADKMNLKNLLQTKEFLLHRHEREYAVDFVKKSYFARENSAFKKEFSPEILNYISQSFDKASVIASQDEKNLGKCYVDPQMKNYAIPDNNSREASKGSVLTTYSIIESQKECNILRPFIWWTNEAENERIDIDLSVNILDETYSSKGLVWYGNLKNDFAVHSGDFVDGKEIDGNGVSEYIDVDKTLLKESGAKYLVFHVHSYSQHAFCDMTNIKFGIMERTGGLADNVWNTDGETFDPRTVATEIVDLNSKGTHSTMAVYDVEKEHFIWMDKNVQINFGLNNVINKESLCGTKAEIYKALEYPHANMYDLFTAQSLANGELVEDIKEADTVFVANPPEKAELKESAIIITPHDLSEISNRYMQKVNEPEIIAERERHDKAVEKDEKIRENGAKMVTAVIAKAVASSAKHIIDMDLGR